MSPSAEELLELRVGQRRSTFRFDVLDRALNRIGQVSPSSEPVVTNNGARTINRTLDSFALASAADAAAFNPYSDRIRPMMVLENGDAWELGVFLFADLSRTPDTPGLYAEATLVDQTIITDQPTDASVTVAAGANLALAAGELLAAAGITYSVAPSAATAATGLSWRAGTTLRAVLADLARLCGFYSPFFDRKGVCRLVAVPDLAFEPAAVVYKKGGRVYHASIVESDDSLSAPNRWVVVDTSAGNAAPITGRYEVPSSAPHSFAARGFYITERVEVQGLGSPEEAQTVAASLGRTSGAGFAHLSFVGAPDPRHETFSVVEFDGVKWHEQAWALPCREGAPMRHDLRRVYS